MNWDAVGAVAETIGALAVLVTLIYLALQVRQARKVQLAESIRATRAERREFFLSLRDSPYIHDILEKRAAGTELTYAESSRLTAHHAANWAQLYSAWLQDDLGLSGGHNTTMASNFRFSWSIPGAEDFIDQYGRSLYPGEFIAEAMRYKEVLGDSDVASDDA